MTNSWKLNAFSLATTFGVAFILCSIFDAVFYPYGFMTVLAKASPYPISGSFIGYLIGFVMSTVVGFVLGAIYGAASSFWSKK